MFLVIVLTGEWYKKRFKVQHPIFGELYFLQVAETTVQRNS